MEVAAWLYIQNTFIMCHTDMSEPYLTIKGICMQANACTHSCMNIRADDHTPIDMLARVRQGPDIHLYTYLSIIMMNVAGLVDEVTPG